MIFDYHCGPFDFQVSWQRRLKPQAVKVPFLSFYLPRDAGFKSPYPLVRFEITEAVKSLSTPPASAIENPENWRVWTGTDKHHVLQVWSGETREYSIEAHISPDYLQTKILCAEAHPSRRKLSVLLSEVTKWVGAHLAFRHGGFLVHAAAVQHKDGSVFLGLGPSGAGKSTFSRFFGASGTRFRVLNDETCLIIKENGRFHAYGTPWPGMLNKAVNAGGPLTEIFVLQKTEGHLLHPLDQVQGMLRVTPELFIPPWNEQVTQSALESAARVVEAVPPRALGFAKDKSIVKFVEEHHHGTQRPELSPRKETGQKKIRVPVRDQSDLEPGAGPA